MTELARRVRATRYALYAGAASLSATILAALMLLTVADVTGRYMLAPIRGTIEISMQMMAYLVFLGLAYTLVKGAHVRVSLALDRFPGRLRTLAEVIADISGVFLCGLLAWGSWAQFWDSWVVWELMPAAIRVPWWPAKLAMPIGFFLIGLQFLAYLFGHLTALARPSMDQGRR